MNNIVHEDNRLFSQQIDPLAASESENLLGQKVDPHKPTLRFLLISLEIALSTFKSSGTHYGCHLLVSGI